jgi:hypothetical protein
VQAMVQIELLDGECERLETSSRNRVLEGRLVLRAQIILLAAGGLSSGRIGEEPGVDYKTVMRWRNRFFAQRFEGIGPERPGCGRKPWSQTGEGVQGCRGHSRRSLRVRCLGTFAGWPSRLA